MKRVILVFSAVIVFIAWIDPFRDAVEKGNNSYMNKRPDEAIENYNEAEKHAPGEPEKKMLDFNRGDAFYMKQDYDRAAGKFSGSIVSENPEVQKRAFFNLGNTYVKQKKYKEAIESYVKALQIDPGYLKAKKNLEYLLKKQKNNEGDDSEKKDGQGDEKKGAEERESEKKMKSIQTKNLLESMKNKPVRKQKGKGERYLEKYW